ncbi:hypothetical protein [Fictibacillus phosphorivorans]|nr:hypothetical protein [Fictibacillus phosphorivorans]
MRNVKAVWPCIFVWRSYFSYGARPTSLTDAGRALQELTKCRLPSINLHM